MWREFRDFAVRGNVIDLAVGLIVGAAFTTIVNSLVNDILMPPIGLLLGGIDFSNFFITLKGGSFPTVEAAKQASQRGDQFYKAHKWDEAAAQFNEPLVVRVRIMGPDAASLAVGELVNLSPQGGQVDLAVPLEQGERVRLTFDIPGGGTPMVLDATVEWQKAGEGRYLHGLVFRELTADAERELLELLRPAEPATG